MSEVFFGQPVRASDVCKTVSSIPNGEKKRQMSTLPWQPPSSPTFSAIGSMIFTSLADSMPIVSQIRANRELRQAAVDPQLDSDDERQLKAIAQARTRETYSQIGAVGSALGLFITYLFYEGIVEWPHPAAETDQGGQRDFGEAGHLLGL